MNNFLNFFNELSIIDFIFLFFLLLNLILSMSHGFVLSLLSFLKWVLAILSVKIFLPVTSIYTHDLIKSEFTHDITFGIIIFFISLFLIILISKGLSKTISWTGLGSVDKFFGTIFGLFKGYVYFIFLFMLLSFVHPHSRWPNNLKNGTFFDSILWGKGILEENIPKRYEYIEKSKENVDKITK